MSDPREVIAETLRYRWCGEWKRNYTHADRIRSALSEAGYVTTRLPDQHELAEWFHNAYETLAPYFSYETRPDSAVPWSDVPEANRALMTATAQSILLRLAAGTTTPRKGDEPDER